MQVFLCRLTRGRSQGASTTQHSNCTANGYQQNFSQSDPTFYSAPPEQLNTSYPCGFETKQSWTSMYRHHQADLQAFSGEIVRNSGQLALVFLFLGPDLQWDGTMQQPELQRPHFPVSNAAYDVMTIIREKSKALQAYDQYIADLQDDTSLRQILIEI